MTRLLSALAPLVLAACTASSGGHFAGTVTPLGMSGPASPAMLCQGITRGGLDLAGSRFDFAPNEGTIVLHGTVDPSGNLSATLSFTGGGHKTYTVQFTGHRHGAEITGRLVTPECQANVALQRR